MTKIRAAGSMLLVGTAMAMLPGLTRAVAQAPMPASAEEKAAAALNPVVGAGESLIVGRTTRLKSLKVEPGAAVAAPAGKSLTLTVDGVQRDVVPGRYTGDVVLNVTDEHVVKFSDLLTHRFRQAILLDERGVNAAQSVTAAAGDYRVTGNVLSGGNIRSDGQNFNGLLVTGGNWTVKNLRIHFEGNGGNDFAGYGAGLMSDGKGTRLIVDGADIFAHGAVRTTVIANNGSNLIVKNSTIAAKTGVLPSDYVSNVTPGEMKDAPWMLAIKGNVRATNLLGDDTKATYINSDLSADGWGVLSIDASQNTHLTTINSKVHLDGEAGYAAFAIGNATDVFLGSSLKSPSYGVINTGGDLTFASSSAANVARLNRELDLRLTAADLAALRPAQTVVDSGRFGVMMRGTSVVTVADGTIFNTGEAVFLDKGYPAKITVDGAGGARLNSRSGVILQAIDDDDPGPVMTDGLMINRGVFHDPTTPAARIAGWDLTATHDDDLVAKFANITLTGDFYNAVRGKSGGPGGPGGAPGGPGGGAPGGMGPGGGAAKPAGKNMILDFTNARLTGVITASAARHRQNPISYENYKALGDVTNVPGAAINNGVVVTLNRSTWTVRGTSYLTGLTIGAGSAVAAPAGRRVTLTVDGQPTPLRAGSYKGDIVLAVAAGG